MLHLLAHAGHDEQGPIAGLLHSLLSVDHLLPAVGILVAIATLLFGALKLAGRVGRRSAQSHVAQ